MHRSRGGYRQPYVMEYVVYGEMTVLVILAPEV